MKKFSVIAFIIFAIVSALVLVFSDRIYEYLSNNIDLDEENYLYGSATGEKGKIALKVRLDSSGSIKEITVTEHSNSDIAVSALQKLIDNSLDKQSADEIDTVSGATDTSNTFKTAISNILYEPIKVDEEVITEKVQLTDPEIQYAIERQVVNEKGMKSGIGGYVLNSFQDADYNKNGNLVTNEYICAVILNQHNRIESVKFDHIISNISFDRLGRIPTGGAKAYTFSSDKSKPGFNGMINDGNYINVYEFEKEVLTLRHFEDVKNRFINKKGYAPFVYALENAIDNARFIGADQGDTLGLSVSKILKKRDIKNATEKENGEVVFQSDYCLLTVDKNKTISSCMFDNVLNKAVITNSGKILGSREKEIYTLNELANTTKYSKIDKSRYDMKIELNILGDFMKGNTIDNMLSLVSELTDDRGQALPDKYFSDLVDIDFIECIDLLSKSYIEAIKISVN